MDQEKRHYRQLKRDVKRAGTRKMRRYLQRDLADNPEEAAHSEFDYGRRSSASLNGNDRDPSRRRNAKEPKADEEE
jgi:hypothetical protein